MKPCLTLLAAWALAWTAATSEEPHFDPLPLGSPAPGFSLPGVDGRAYSLEDFQSARLLCLVFTCNHCPTAQAYEERIKALARDYAPRGVAVVAVSPNSPAAVRFDELGYTDLGDTLGEMKLRAKHHQFNFPYLFDGETESLSKKCGPAATPHVFIFDEKRRLQFSGRIDDSERPDLVKTRDTRNALEALLEGKAPPVRQTKVFGCSTKWDYKAESNQRWMDKVRSEPVALAPVDAAALKALRANQGGDKLRLIHAWATWCGPCVSEFDDVIETNLRFRHRDFELVTVAAQFPDEQPQVLKFLQRHHASTRNLYFGDTDKYKMLEALDPEWNGALPYTLLVDPKGKVVYRHTGELDFVDLRRQIVPALNAITPWPGMK